MFVLQTKQIKIGQYARQKKLSVFTMLKSKSKQLRIKHHYYSLITESTIQNSKNKNKLLAQKLYSNFLGT